MAGALIRLLRALLALAALVAAPASAHLMANSVVNLDFATAATTAEILIPLNDLQLASDIRVDPANPASTMPAARAYLSRHIRAIAPDGRPFTVVLDRLFVLADPSQADLNVAARFVPPAGASPRVFTLRYDAVIDRVPNHFVLVFARSDFAGGVLSGDPQMIGGLQAPTVAVRVDRGGGSAWAGFAAAMRLGMHHIAEGHDHLLFLIALILPAPLLAAGRRWGGYAGLHQTARRLLAVVTAFTIGHSVTLIGGAFFGWQLPARPVEVGIALSILVSAIHAWRPLFAGREALIAGGFGLVHGLAFATIIANFGLEPLAKAQSILGFNLGIELVQLAVVACVMPALLLLAQTPAYAPFRTVGAGLTAVAAVAWIVERVSGTPNPVAEGIDGALGYAPWGVAVLTVVALAGWGLRGRPARADTSATA
ncbi:HupE/UreJ family protein [Sphingomonas solaris]|uniref:HupE/UreJ family protein n=1 Tax=Alterirhizorhabdus solaris TaxID=2529389 RepID=A0A558QX70_9SPHN|nr:HupE/UreJ family protein [Sphingomonas solaris]TVV71744.1 HupE/UreJ family protein [Sphingomonas solaris]